MGQIPVTLIRSEEVGVRRTGFGGDLVFRSFLNQGIASNVSVNSKRKPPPPGLTPEIYLIWSNSSPLPGGKIWQKYEPWAKNLTQKAHPGEKFLPIFSKGDFYLIRKKTAVLMNISKSMD